MTQPNPDTFDGTPQQVADVCIEQFQRTLNDATIAFERLERHVRNARMTDACEEPTADDGEVMDPHEYWEATDDAELISRLEKGLLFIRTCSQKLAAAQPEQV